jgi:hypothetical protein
MQSLRNPFQQLHHANTWSDTVFGFDGIWTDQLDLDDAFIIRSLALMILDDGQMLT